MAISLLQNGLSTTPQNVTMPQLRQDIPAYYLKAPVWLEDEYIEAGKFIYHPTEPNEAMEPANELAVKEFRKFLTKLDAHEKKRCERDNLQFISKLALFDKEPDPEEVELNRSFVAGRNTDPHAIFAMRKGKRKSAVVGSVHANGLKGEAKEVVKNG